MNLNSTTASAPVTPACPGAPLAFSEKIVDLLYLLIRTRGLSDHRAAALMGLHPTTVARWKREQPGFVVGLLQAREQFRDQHLSVIMKASEAKGGWRAAAWLLERVFPADYHPKAAERERFQKVEDAKDELMAAAEAETAPEPKPEPEIRPEVQASTPASTFYAPSLRNYASAPDVRMAA